ncbi:hypothetical protein [Segetibacter sp.]|jgi:hypothetical protein|uniref:hypothetical protein n=1 Tax=Segetibacter sp. TaxID=2231182 RepID=UPI002611D25D|nr:hypothetical protein [Segetibacter sp.]MCW3080813.1 hypothetical protein [Segetibacter sp.]
MKQREVTDSQNTRWTCVQAFSMAKQEASKKAESISETEEGKVTVVCTPSGGAKTVRLKLDTDWQEQMTDESLTKAIIAGGK